MASKTVPSLFQPRKPWLRSDRVAVFDLNTPNWTATNGQCLAITTARRYVAVLKRSGDGKGNYNAPEALVGYDACHDGFVYGHRHLPEAHGTYQFRRHPHVSGAELRPHQVVLPQEGSRPSM